MQKMFCVMGSLFVGVAVAVLAVPQARADLFLTSEGVNNVAGSVLRYNESTGAFISSFVPAGSGGLVGPLSLEFGSDGNLYVLSAATNQVLRYNGATGAFLDIFATAGGLGNNPTALTFGPTSENLYVSTLLGGIQQFDGTTGASMGFFVPAGSGGLAGASDLAFGPDGNLYVSAFGSIKRYNGTTGAFINNLVPSVLGQGIEWGPDGNLYVSRLLSDDVLRYDGTTGALIGTFVSPGSGGLDQPRDLAFGPDNNLYVLNGIDDVLRYNGTTGALIDQFIPDGSGGLHGTSDLAFFNATSGPIIPEPSSLLLLASGLATLTISHRKRAASCHRPLSRSAKGGQN
jgi:hypothetical protein